MPKMMKGFEQSKMDNDKGVKEGSPADMKRDAKEMKQMSGGMGKKPKGVAVEIKMAPANKMPTFQGGVGDAQKEMADRKARMLGKKK